MQRPKILFWDLETSPIIAAVWGTFDQTIPLNHIREDWYIICGSWAYMEGDSKSICVSPQNPKNDYEVVRKLHEIISDADIIVAHNGDGFDIKKFNARALKYELPPIPPKPSVDTLKVARRYFKITSNKLDFLGDFLGVGRKIDTPKGLWTRCMEGEREALSQMVAYNKQDVYLLRDVYLKLRPYITNHPDANGFHKFPDKVCPKCASHDVVKEGMAYRKQGSIQRYSCNSCGGWHT